MKTFGDLFREEYFRFRKFKMKNKRLKKKLRKYPWRYMSPGLLVVQDSVKFKKEWDRVAQDKRRSNEV